MEWYDNDDITLVLSPALITLTLHIPGKSRFRIPSRLYQFLRILQPHADVLPRSHLCSTTIPSIGKPSPGSFSYPACNFHSFGASVGGLILTLVIVLRRIGGVSASPHANVDEGFKVAFRRPCPVIPIRIATSRQRFPPFRFNYDLHTLLDPGSKQFLWATRCPVLGLAM
jgi:hypothetical protein